MNCLQPITTIFFAIFVCNFLAPTNAAPKFMSDIEHNVYNDWISHEFDATDSNSGLIIQRDSSPFDSMDVEEVDYEKSNEDKRDEEPSNSNVVVEQCFTSCTFDSQCTSMTCSKCLKPFGICVKMEEVSLN